MMFSKRTHKIFLALLAVVLLSACEARPVASKPAPTVSKTITPTYNSLSGKFGTDGPTLVVKIDDTRQAHPQIGIEDADVVYIEQVEGGLTRLAAVFSSVIPARIGPVRSARISDIDLLAQYGHVAFAYSGAQSKMLPVIAAANLENLGAQRESQTIYVRDLTRQAPVNLILRGDLLMQKMQSAGVAIEPSHSVGWSFGEAPVGGESIISVGLKWPANSYSANWSETQRLWLLSHNGVPDLAANGVQLGASTLVIQEVSITNSIYKDKFGGVTPFSATVGTGGGYILRDGKAFPALWQRATAQQGTTWTDLHGAPINFARGQIWVGLLANAPTFTYPPSPTLTANTPTASTTAATTPTATTK